MILDGWMDGMLNTRAISMQGSDCAPCLTGLLHCVVCCTEVEGWGVKTVTGGKAGRESWLICWKVCACRSLLRRRLRSWSGRNGRSKVVEVFRRLRDGDAVEIEKNFRVALPIIWLYRQCLQALLVAGKEKIVQG